MNVAADHCEEAERGPSSLWSACRSLLIQTGEKCQVKSATLLLLCVLYVGLFYVWHECLERRSN
jgi:hypothetical protein